MRQESVKIARAFINREPASAARTRTDGTSIYLHGNKIAWWVDDRSVALTMAGWGTAVTRERLNAVCHYLIGRRPYGQRDFIQYFDDEPILSTDVRVIHLISGVPDVN